MDFNGTGRTDIISGSWPGELYLFRRNANGTFAAGEKIKDKDGKPLKPGSASVPFAFDWRNTGKLDLICGTVEGKVLLYVNEGTAKEPAYGKPVAVEADGKEILAPHGDSGPVVADWDGDGKPDLILGCGDGSVVWYRNIGTRSEPKLAKAETLIPAPKQDEVKDDEDPPETKECPHGTRAKVCVADFNGDGRPDLLVGDFAMKYGPKPKLTDEDKKEQIKLRKDAEEIQKKLEPYYNEVREVYTAHEKKKDATEKDQKELETKVEEIAKKFKKELDEQRVVYEKLRKYERPYEYIGSVWVYLRKPGEKAGAVPR